MSQFIPGGISLSCVAPLGKGSLNLVYSASPHLPFPFADFALNFFATINHSCECDCMLSPVSPPSQSSNLGVILGPTKQKQRYYQNLVLKKN